MTDDGPWTCALLVGGTLAFIMHDGGHGMVAEDWPVYLDYLETNLAK
ncbi:MAG: hypothetical protein KDA44_11545 [Planctomycetales bacterium]|nr:hypothetical protein [Planctomycetales bacterium]